MFYCIVMCYSSHGNKEVFSCRGIKLCVDWFRARGHKEITVFVPKWRKEAARPDNLITGMYLREINGKHSVFVPIKIFFLRRGATHTEEALCLCPIYRLQ